MPRGDKQPVSEMPETSQDINSFMSAFNKKFDTFSNSIDGVLQQITARVLTCETAISANNADNLQIEGNSINTVRQPTNEVNSQSSLPNLKWKDIILQFDSLKTNPMEYLDSVERFISIHQNISTAYLLNLIKLTMTSVETRNWFNIVERNFTTYLDFKEAFIQHFWGPTTQFQYKINLFNGKFDLNRDRKREDYVTNKFAIVQYLEPKMSEGEIVKLLGNHFEGEIARGVVIQKIETYAELINLVKTYDAVCQNEDRRNTQRYRTTNVQEGIRGYPEYNRPNNQYHNFNRQNFQHHPPQNFQQHNFNSNTNRHNGNNQNNYHTQRNQYNNNTNRQANGYNNRNNYNRENNYNTGNFNPRNNNYGRGEQNTRSQQFNNTQVENENNQSQDLYQNTHTNQTESISNENHDNQNDS